MFQEIASATLCRVLPFEDYDQIQIITKRKVLLLQSMTSVQTMHRVQTCADCLFITVHIKSGRKHCTINLWIS